MGYSNIEGVEIVKCKKLYMRGVLCDLDGGGG
jgi:hypothetical protein